MRYQSYTEAIESVKDLCDDLSFGYARSWKAEDPVRRIIGFLPIYVPRELIHAAKMLPVGIFGAGDRIPVVRGDAFFQSYICHLPRSVVELALNGSFDAFDGFIFPSICDVIRNLSGVFKLKFKGKLARYLEYPQNFDPAVGGMFYRSELERLQDDLCVLNGIRPGVADLNRSITLYNRSRHLLLELDQLRVQQPHRLSAVEFYLIRRTGNILSVEDYNALLEKLLEVIQEVDQPPEDKIRVVVTGAFCEQPPVGLIKTIENAGCHIVDDDFQFGLTWFSQDIPDDTDDPIDVLVQAYLRNSTDSSAVFEKNGDRGELLVERVLRRRADGVIFCAPSFCDPALLDRPLMERALNRHHIKYTSFQYHENLGQFQVIKEQAGTFADMIKLWE
ncbi:MAG TPA: benzoyl-CoA reductase subunit C [Candidatus Deferrimicrobium sp.]|nr:benzoyl-CoA reductase subunit C [Candidatus Deferrimicrobium sp.]